MTDQVVFEDRRDAGRRLSRRLARFRVENPVVLGLPRGGVPVAAEVANALDAPLDVIVVRKLGLPTHPEVAMGAIGEGGVRFVDGDLIARMAVSAAELQAVESRERATLEARVWRFRSGREAMEIAGRTVIIVDDGIATGATARVACRVARALGASRIVLAAPVAPSAALDQFPDADEIVCEATPDFFWAVGAHYLDFSETTDDDVVAILDAAARRAGSTRRDPADVDAEVTITAGDVDIQAHLHVPAGAGAIIVFAHGSGSSRRSPRNLMVASVLADAGFGYLLLDMLTPAEDASREYVFDIELLARRLTAATDWLATRPETASCRIGYFGASTGAAGALLAASSSDSRVAAIVSRGGRPDLAGLALPAVTAPTLLIVGGRDETVLDLNIRAERHLHCENRLVVIDGATHLFEEPGALERVAALARDWFVRHLVDDVEAASEREGKRS